MDRLITVLFSHINDMRYDNSNDRAEFIKFLLNKYLDENIRIDADEEYDDFTQQRKKRMSESVMLTEDDRSHDYWKKLIKIIEKNDYNSLIMGNKYFGHRIYPHLKELIKGIEHEDNMHDPTYKWDNWHKTESISPNNKMNKSMNLTNLRKSLKR